MNGQRILNQLARMIPLVFVISGCGRADPGAPSLAPAPLFRDVSVHDPSTIRTGNSFYVFGSHLAAAKTKDLMRWDMVAEGVNPANRLFNNVVEELKETFAWAQTTSLWAPDVIRLGDGRYYMYYDACKGDSPRSALGVAVADSAEGPYRNMGILLKSGMWGQPSEDGTIYDARIHPNVVDPNVFFDHQGKLWMVYGSYSGGIFILKMHAKTGKPLPGQGYGKRLLGGNHSRIEAPYILYHPKTKFYYLYLSYGGLDAAGGYNIRVARARQPDGPYLDSEGNTMANVKANPDRPLFDDRSIEPFGVKLMGNFLFEPQGGGLEKETGRGETGSGETGSGETGSGYVSPGHNSAYYDPATGRQYLIFHTRFPGKGNFHQVRVHQFFMNRNGWPVVAPWRYAGETAGKVKREEVIGEYRYVNHGKAITAEIQRSRPIELQKDGSISGAVRGTWKLAGDNRATLVMEGGTFEGVFVRQWDPDSTGWVMAFTALSKQGVAVWGSRRRTS